MVYLISRSICQGQAAGMISLVGVALGFVFYMTSAAFGITALVMAIPLAYDTLRTCGALYLLYLAWQAVKPGGRSPFQVRDLPRDTPRRLFTMGFLTQSAESVRSGRPTRIRLPGVQLKISPRDSKQGDQRHAGCWRRNTMNTRYEP
jgi:hypothetical protein